MSAGDACTLGKLVFTILVKAKICLSRENVDELNFLKPKNSRRMDKEMWYIYTRDYYSAMKKRKSAAICDNMVQPRATMLSKPDTKRQALHDLTQMGSKNIDPIEVGSTMMVTRGWVGWRRW
jgi:hypothetical protein